MIDQQKPVTGIDRRGDIIARAIRDERDAWMHREDEDQIAQRAGDGSAHDFQNLEETRRWLSYALIMYVTEGTNPLEAPPILGVNVGRRLQQDSVGPARYALAARVAAYQLEADRAAIARATLLGK